ncbi:SRPBCC domain-containing protein [Pararhodobacter sp.]|uniref:SRPBCC domain-containing protein n=1 Tax=Pararhodobacter sp. TaxID=2127056 RepID=UPI002D1FC0E7|nr:SRPBCC domain-containing protein [Pararhodobacter sp.]
MTPDRKGQTMPLRIERTAPTTAVVTRQFAAPPAHVFAAHSEPALVRQWLTGPDGWVMARCEIDLRPGGTLRYDWQRTDGSGAFHLTADVLAVEAPHRIEHVERMFLPDPTPDNTVETRFVADGGGTRMVMTMRVADAATMDQMLETGMADGMEASYARLDALPR